MWNSFDMNEFESICDTVEITNNIAVIADNAIVVCGSSSVYFN